jgi:hypothetical protein
MRLDIITSEKDIRIMDDKFDIVICLGPNDVNIINLMINYTKNNIIGYRNIYIISYDHNIKIDGCIIINENLFPFNKDTIIHNNNKWYLQQLLKLYSSIIIDGILDNVLIIDAVRLQLFLIILITLIIDMIKVY